MRGQTLMLAYGEPDGEGVVQGVPGCAHGGLQMADHAHSSDDHQGNLGGEGVGKGELILTSLKANVALFYMNLVLWSMKSGKYGKPNTG